MMQSRTDKGNVATTCCDNILALQIDSLLITHNDIVLSRIRIVISHCFIAFSSFWTKGRKHDNAMRRGRVTNISIVSSHKIIWPSNLEIASSYHYIASSHPFSRLLIVLSRLLIVISPKVATPFASMENRKKQ